MIKAERSLGGTAFFALISLLHSGNVLPILLDIHGIPKMWSGPHRWLLISSLANAIIFIVTVILLCVPVRHPAARYTVAFVFGAAVALGADSLVRCVMESDTLLKIGMLPSRLATALANALAMVVFLLPFSNRLNQIAPIYGRDELLD